MKLEHCMKCGSKLMGMERYINWETMEIIVKKHCETCKEDVTFEFAPSIKDITYKERD